MSKIVLINSLGPMGSSLLSGFVEKFGFSNYPLRKIHLHKYLMGDLSLDSGSMEGRLAKVLNRHSDESIELGGVSVVSRGHKRPSKLVDEKRVQESLRELHSKKFQSVGELYCKCRDIYKYSQCYKNDQSNPDWHLEQGVDFFQYDPYELYERYKKEFDEVYFIHLIRSFEGWINSKASQAFAKKKLMERLRLFPHVEYRNYEAYCQTIRNAPGLIVDFDELFDSTPLELAHRLGHFLEVGRFPQKTRKFAI